MCAFHTVPFPRTRRSQNLQMSLVDMALNVHAEAREAEREAWEQQSGNIQSLMVVTTLLFESVVSSAQHSMPAPRQPSPVAPHHPRRAARAWPVATLITSSAPSRPPAAGMNQQGGCQTGTCACAGDRGALPRGD